MYLSIPPTSFLVAFLIFAFTFQLSAQDDICLLPPPTEVEIIASNNGYYSFSWPPNNAAIAYDVVVIDAVSGQILHQEVTQDPFIEITDPQFPEDTYIGIAAICDNGLTGGHGYFIVESNSTIIVQDIVMQMEGENGSRTLECNAEKTTIQSVSFSGGITSSFVIAPPFNPSSVYQIEGAIIDVSLYDQTSGGTFAKATMLAFSNSNVINAASQINVSSTGSTYKLISPVSQNFFKYSASTMGEFDFIVNTIVPGGGTYELVVEQRNCFNVRKISKKSGNVPLISEQGEQFSMQQTSKKVSEDLEVLLYPNPSSDYIQFSRDSKNITIRNYNGQVVYQVDQLSAQQLIPISSLASGVYFLEATTIAGNNEVVQFVKS